MTDLADGLDSLLQRQMQSPVMSVCCVFVDLSVSW